MTFFSVSEIFYSIQGEAGYSGYPCVFIRLAGCHLRCHWCDTSHAYDDGQLLSLPDILLQVEQYPVSLVEITGGEPLLQENIDQLFSALSQAGKKVLLETSGSLSLEKVPQNVHIIMDLKAPASGESASNFMANLSWLKSSDEIKIAIADRHDFDWASEMARNLRFSEILERPVLLQPVFGQLDPADLAAWIKEEPGFFRMGLQLHKIIYPEHSRGV